MSPNELPELASIAETLNQESNEINSTIASLNKELAALNLGIEVWCGPWDEDPIQIGFAKVEDGKTSSWELATRTCVPIIKKSDFGYEEWEAKPGSAGEAQPLIRASRNVRIDGLQVVSQIISALKAAALGKVDAIRNAKKIAADLAVKA